MKLELKHIAPYLPYHLMVLNIQTGKLMRLSSISNLGFLNEKDYQFGVAPFGIDTIKPILKPLSSMTVEEVEELNSLIDDSVKVVVSSGNWVYIESASSDPWDGSPTLSLDSINIINEYLFKNHFDVFNLIDNNLAIDKTNNHENNR